MVHLTLFIHRLAYFIIEIGHFRIKRDRVRIRKRNFPRYFPAIFRIILHTLTLGWVVVLVIGPVNAFRAKLDHKLYEPVS